jgi:tetratricopeptide (TPR) repeat protein
MGAPRWASSAVVTAAGVLILGLAAITHERAAAWSDSFSLWRSTLARFPRCSLAWQKLASAYFLDHRLEEAAAIAEEGFHAVPDDLHVALNAAVLLTELGRLSQAEEVLSAVERAHPQAPEVLNQRGALAMRRGEPAVARDFFNTAAKRRPGWEQPYLSLTYALEQAHDVPAALGAARRAIELAPAEPEGRRRLVELLIRERRNDEALAALEDLTRMFPRDADAWRNRIDLLRQAGRATEADDVVRRATRYVPPERLL